MSGPGTSGPGTTGRDEFRVKITAATYNPAARQVTVVWKPYQLPPESVDPNAPHPLTGFVLTLVQNRSVLTNYDVPDPNATSTTVDLTIEPGSECTASLTPTGLVSIIYTNGVSLPVSIPYP